MNEYLLWGLIVGALCVVVNLFLWASAKQAPVLGIAIEILISAVGAAGGVKVCRYVLTGKLTDAFKKNGFPLSEEDVVYFLIGGFALIWLSFESIFRRLWGTYAEAKRIRAAMRTEEATATTLKGSLKPVTTRSDEKLSKH